MSNLHEGGEGEGDCPILEIPKVSGHPNTNSAWVFVKRDITWIVYVLLFNSNEWPSNKKGRPDVHLSDYFVFFLDFNDDIPASQTKRIL